MKIAYDLRRIASVGIGRYMKTLVEAVAKIAPQHEYVLIMAPGTDRLLQTPESLQRIYARSRYYSISEQFELPRLLRKHHIDVLHAPHFVVPLMKSCPTIVTIHDAIHLVYPKDIASPIGRIYARWMMGHAARIADKIITISEHSKQDLIRLVGADERKISVIPAFLDPNIQPVREAETLEFVRRRYGIHKEYILYMGIFRERKNHIGLIRAFARLILQGHDLELVISGPVEEGNAILSKQAHELGVLDRIVFAGFIDEKDMSGLYSGAAVYACPSLYEGFGVTPLEAMACGTPVVCHHGTSLPEVCGSAALYSDATQPEQFALALDQALSDTKMRSRMTTLGLANAQRFSVYHTATATLNLYSQLQGISHRPTHIESSVTGIVPK